MIIPLQYHWLVKEKSPKILVEAVKLMGIDEIKGIENNPKIMQWAKELGGVIAHWYNEDEKPWCGLFVAVCAKRAGLSYPEGFDALRAKKWALWGNPAGQPMLGDVLVFERAGGGHVGLYVGQDESAYHVLGGNQSDSVRVSRIDKRRLIAARRTPWKLMQPKNIRPIWLAANGQLSKNEA